MATQSLSQDASSFADAIVRHANNAAFLRKTGGGIRRYGVLGTHILLEGVARVEMLDGGKCRLRLADDDGGWEPGSHVVTIFEATHTIIEVASYGS
jgi:hypothetical protein